MEPLFETILNYIPSPEGDPDAPTQVLISTIDYNDYVGRIGVGKVENGTISVNQEVLLVNEHDPDKKQKVKISNLYEFDGLNKIPVDQASVGSIVAISGIADLHIGDTICTPENPEPHSLPEDFPEPTIAMNFLVNRQSPGRPGGKIRDIPSSARPSVPGTEHRRQSSGWKKQIPPSASKYPAAASCTCPY